MQWVSKQKGELHLVFKPRLLPLLSYPSSPLLGEGLQDEPRCGCGLCAEGAHGHSDSPSASKARQWWWYVRQP